MRLRRIVHWRRRRRENAEFAAALDAIYDTVEFFDFDFKAGGEPSHD